MKLAKVYRGFLGILLAVSAYACSPASPKIVIPANVRGAPPVTYDKIETTGSSISTIPKVDILFIVDNSGSMMTHQTNLSDNIDLFIEEFKKMNVDYHIGVISTDPFEEPGELQDGEKDWWTGRGTGVKYVTPTTPDGLNILKKNILLGTSGSATEAVFDPLMLALSPDYTKVGGVNAGFLREEAFLAIMVISDAEDQSRSTNATGAFNYLVNLKQSQRKVLNYGIIVPVDVNDCTRDDSTLPRKIESFLLKSVNADPVTKKNIMSLCDSQFGQKLSAFSKDLVRYLNGMVKLERAPLLSSIKVFYGTQEILPDMKKGWYYDPVENAVVIGDEVVMDDSQPEGTVIKVYYEAMRFPEQGAAPAP